MNSIMMKICCDFKVYVNKERDFHCGQGTFHFVFASPFICFQNIPFSPNYIRKMPCLPPYIFFLYLICLAVLQLSFICAIRVSSFSYYSTILFSLYSN